MERDSLEISKLIDHTMLKAEASYEGIENLCKQADEFGFYSVCVNPHHVALASRLLKGRGVKVCTVIGFPLGANTIDTKVFESNNALENGAKELDVVINIGAVKSGDYRVVEREIKAIRELSSDFVLKVILETCYLTDQEKVNICKIAVGCGADFVKTSTGFGTAGATIEDVQLLRKTVGPDFGVKASGGIRDLQTLQSMVAAGANRIGTSSGMIIMKEFMIK
jgi:deoxyribose-phosphate aldolase